MVITVFLVYTGHLFYLTMDQLTARGPEGVEFPLQLMLGDEKFWLVFLFIPPLLTMRLFAEERSTGTLEMLMTAPLRDWQVVLSKYAAAFAFYLLMWTPTLIYLVVLLSARTAESSVDPMPVLSSFVGVVLVGAMFLAIGLFVSSLVKNQLVAALIAMCISVVFIVVGCKARHRQVGADLQGRFLHQCLSHFTATSAEAGGSRHLVLYLSVTVFCLFLTVRSLESRRWR